MRNHVLFKALTTSANLETPRGQSDPYEHQILGIAQDVKLSWKEEEPESRITQRKIADPQLRQHASRGRSL